MANTYNVSTLVGQQIVQSLHARTTLPFTVNTAYARDYKNGSYNPGETVSDFEKLFRSQLSHLFDLLDEPKPDYLSEVFAVGSGKPSLGGVMKKND